MGDKVSGENDYFSWVVLGGTLVIGLGGFLVYKLTQKGDEDSDNAQNANELEDLTSKEHVYDQRKKRNQKKKKNEIEASKPTKEEPQLEEVKDIIKEQPKVQSKKAQNQPVDEKPKDNKKEEPKEQPEKEEEVMQNNSKKKKKKKKAPAQKKDEPKIETKTEVIEDDEEGEWVEVGKKKKDSEKYKNQQERIKQDYDNYLEQF